LPARRRTRRDAPRRRQPRRADSVSPEAITSSRAHFVGDRFFSEKSIAAAPTAGRRAGIFAGNARSPALVQSPARRPRRGRDAVASPCAALHARRPAAGENQIDCLEWPISRGRRMVRDDQGTPKRRQKTPKVASSRHRAYPPTAQLHPPATAKPSTAAMKVLTAAAGSVHRRDRVVAAELAFLFDRPRHA